MLPIKYKYSWKVTYEYKYWRQLDEYNTNPNINHKRSTPVNFIYPQILHHCYHWHGTGNGHPNFEKKADTRPMAMVVLPVYIYSSNCFSCIFFQRTGFKRRDGSHSVFNVGCFSAGKGICSGKRSDVSATWYIVGIYQ